MEKYIVTNGGEVRSGTYLSQQKSVTGPTDELTRTYSDMGGSPGDISENPVT